MLGEEREYFTAGTPPPRPTRPGQSTPICHCSSMDQWRSDFVKAWDNCDVGRQLELLRNQPQGTEARVCDDIAERQALGIKKYGTTVSENPLELREWLQHAYEECLDQAIYLKRAIEEVEVLEDEWYK